MTDLSFFIFYKKSTKVALSFVRNHQRVELIKTHFHVYCENTSYCVLNLEFIFKNVYMSPYSEEFYDESYSLQHML